MEVGTGRRRDIGISVRLNRSVNEIKRGRYGWSAPNRHGKPALRAEHSLHLGQRTGLIGNMAHPEVRHDHIELSVSEGKLLRIRLDKGCVWHSVPSKRKHDCRKIGTDNPTAAADQCRRDIALSAAQVECFETGLSGGRIPQAANRLLPCRGKKSYLCLPPCRLRPAATVPFCERGE